MKIVFAGGGTAGHVNPALAVAGYICKQEPDSQVWLSGGKGNIEEKLAAKAGYPIYTFPLKGLSRAKSLAGVKQTVRALLDMQKATGECKKILRDIRPDVVMGTGGYASFPMVRAAAQLGLKTAVLEVNATPGIATKQLAKKVDCTMLSFAETEKLVPGAKRTVLTGSPVREEILRCREKEYAPLFDNDKPTLVCFWGSVGAKYMNEKMVEVAQLVTQRQQFNLLQVSGASHYGWMKDALTKAGVVTDKGNFRLTDYLYDMDRVMAKADLILCRAGGTLSELCAAGTPAVVVPSPYVAENHQEKNARILEAAGAVKVLTEKEATPDSIYDTLWGLLQAPEVLAEMGRNARAKAQPDVLEHIYQTLKTL
ncbi:MAG: UDP-N-acetylglucosamine--N-acetylmuramyl-(pentapeptide) pyrophosphoryl-undecaprenol N-acetylglucosamine transferase [Clostridia bacterium]|nr:UDP-N-acetylglucosamine--N-acetylmuramyl-(pentapeptide) pyrophosphoryl-undecaprenol N-acetylglucosamine transferase [Clostridia bacterium]